MTRIEDTTRYHIAAQLLPLQALLIPMITPIYYGALAEQRHYDNEQIAALATADSAGGLLGLGLLTLILARINRRHAGFACVAIMVVTNLLNVAYGSPSMTLVLRFLQAIPSNFAFGLACAYFGNTAQPDRWFAWRATIAVCIQGIGFLILPSLLQRHGPEFVYWLAIGLAPLTAWALITLPARAAPYESASAPAAAHAADRVSRRTLLALCCWVAASAAFGFYYQPLFVFSERLGNRLGLDANAVGVALSVSTFLGIIGSLAVSWQGDSWGRARPIALGCAAGLGVCLLLMNSQAVSAYWVGLSIFSVVWSYLPCFMLGYLSVADRSGRFVVASQLAAIAGTMLSTAITGLLLQRFGLDAAARVSIAGIVATFTLSIVGAFMYQQVTRNRLATSPQT